MIDKLRKALDLAGNTHGLDDVLDLVEKGAATMFIDYSGPAIIVTEVHEYPKRKHLHFWLAAGEKSAVIALGYQALAWGRDHGCTKATISGRKGWTRVLEAEGWKPSRQVVMERDI
jgi:hypothetical protein